MHSCRAASPVGHSQLERMRLDEAEETGARTGRTLMQAGREREIGSLRAFPSGFASLSTRFFPTAPNSVAGRSCFASALTASSVRKPFTCPGVPPSPRRKWRRVCFRVASQSVGGSVTRFVGRLVGSSIVCACVCVHVSVYACEHSGPLALLVAALYLCCAVWRAINAAAFPLARRARRAPAVCPPACLPLAGGPAGLRGELKDTRTGVQGCRHAFLSPSGHKHNQTDEFNFKLQFAWLVGWLVS